MTNDTVQFIGFVALAVASIVNSISIFVLGRRK